MNKLIQPIKNKPVIKTKIISIAIPSAILLLVFGCASLRPKNDLQKANISGKVKSIKHLFYDYNDGVDSVETYVVEKYNKLGYVIVREMHQYDGSIDYYSYKFDHKNDVIEQREYNTDKVLVAASTFAHKYNKKGDKVEIKEFDENRQLNTTIIFKQEKEKNILTVENKEYQKDSTLVHRIVQKYDTKKNHLLEFAVYSLEGKFDYKTQYKCDAQGNPFEMTTYNMEGEIKNIASLTYTLDTRKNWVKSTYYEQGEPTSVTEREITYY